MAPPLRKQPARTAPPVGGSSALTSKHGSGTTPTSARHDATSDFRARRLQRRLDEFEASDGFFSTPSASLHIWSVYISRSTIPRPRTIHNPRSTIDVPRSTVFDRTNPTDIPASSFVPSEAGPSRSIATPGPGAVVGPAGQTKKKQAANVRKILYARKNLKDWLDELSTSLSA
ncbi:hypothetical protein EHS25_003890 [Saitozyma podzolica]|uniref:Uncharacterized protein n=1 Tax=Saitozyma podzolica TaxID=1890683 RepID=A0A427Y3U2_9TREE|nr:hypothetical protein EHS25_003890 [Saitozyma podzolica]